MPWPLRGLRDGVVTTRYPRRPDEYADTFRGSVSVTARDGTSGASVEAVCPTGAIRRIDSTIALDRGRCILCGRCVTTFPETFVWTSGAHTTRLDRQQLVVTPEGESPAELDVLRHQLRRRVKALRRSVHIRHVDAGSDGSEEWEIHALLNPTYDVHRLGIFFTASPRHADILMVTGAGARAMIGPLLRTQQAMAQPIVIMAVGTDAITGGLVADSYATNAGIAADVPVDVWVPGSPPSPFTILHGVLLALGRVPAREPNVERSTASTAGFDPMTEPS